MQAQQLFIVFFAIFWGTSSNAWPKWKPFHWTYVSYPRVLARIIWSFLVLNILPVFFFGAVYFKLGSASDQDHWKIIIKGIIPAFSVFGLYRVWIAGIEFKPSLFYYESGNKEEFDALSGLDPIRTNGKPGEGEIRISREHWYVNLLFGAGYIAISWLVTYL